MAPRPRKTQKRRARKTYKKSRKLTGKMSNNTKTDLVAVYRRFEKLIEKEGEPDSFIMSIMLVSELIEKTG